MRNFKIVLAGLVGVAVVGVAACGSGSNAQGTATPAAPEAPTAPSGAGAHAGAQTLESVPAGGTATIQTDQSTFGVKVHSVTCGAAAAADIRAKVAWTQYMDGSDPYASRLKNPPPGQQWCVIVLDTTNTGHENDSWSLADDQSGGNTLDVGDTAYQADEVTSAASYEFEAWANDHGQPGPSYGLNPGVSGRDYGVFAIPAGAKPTSIWLDQTSAVGSEAGIELAL